MSAIYRVPYDFELTRYRQAIQGVRDVQQGVHVRATIMPLAGPHSGGVRSHELFHNAGCELKGSRPWWRRCHWPDHWFRQHLVDERYGLSAQLGWPGMPWLRLPPGDRPWDKRRAIEGWLEEHGARPFIWVDDDRRIVSSGRPWARRLSVPSLLIRPRTVVGLTPAHLNQMEYWIARIGAVGQVRE